MKKKRRRRGVSAGTVLMLLLTAAVVLACAVFLALLLGDGMYEKTGALIRSLSERGLFETEMTPEETPVPAAIAAVVNLIEESAAPSAPPATPRPAPKPVTLTIAAAGTIYAPKAVRESAQESGGRYDFSPVFAGLGDTLADADLAIATLETTTAGKDKGFGNYNTAPEILDGLRDCGVDILSLGTEHALDKGYEGLDLTVSELTTRGIAYAGVYPDGQRVGKATMLSIDGVQVAVLAYSYGLSEESSQKTDDDRQGVLAKSDVGVMIRDVTQARVAGANLVIVLPHWGTKNKAETPDTVRRMARQLAEAGADVILGTHPNVAQGTERLTVTRSDGLEHDALVCYSLGTLLTDARTPENTAGMVAHVSVTFDPASRRITLDDMYCTPVYVARQREDGETVYRVVDAEDSRQLEVLDEAERQAAGEAVEIIRRATGQSGQEGQG